MPRFARNDNVGFARNDGVGFARHDGTGFARNDGSSFVRNDGVGLQARARQAKINVQAWVQRITGGCVLGIGTGRVVA